MRRAPGLVIMPGAERDWARFDVSGTIQEAVDTVFGLPLDQVTEHDSPRAGSNWKIAHVRLQGRLFMMGGYKGPDGAWTRIDQLSPVEPRGGARDF